MSPSAYEMSPLCSTMSIPPEEASRASAATVGSELAP
jgi:hypothetical protein